MDWLGQISPYQGLAYRTVAWWFLPSIATRTVLTVYYALLVRIGFSHRIPPNDSPKRSVHYRRAFAIVVLSYLAWTLVVDLIEQPPSFYSLLGVSANASDIEIKNAYKMFARRNHPDRVGPAGQPLFIQVRDAYEALKHPIKRYGYDRFGFEALEWKVAENPHAVLYKGLENAGHYYVPTGAFMLVLAVIGRAGQSAYWRYVTWLLVATLEACLILGFNPLSSYSNPLAPVLSLLAPLVPASVATLQLIPSMAPYQWVLFLRHLFFSVAIALGNVLPVLFPPPPTAKEEQARESEIARLAIALDPVVRQIIVHSHLSNQQAQETFLKEIQYLRTTTPPPVPSIQLTDAHRTALAELAPTMQRLVVQHALMSDPNLQPPFVSALQRTHDLSKERDREVAFAGIGRDQLTPAPEDMDVAARLMAIPSPPSSVFAVSREATPEISYATRFGSATRHDFATPETSYATAFDSATPLDLAPPEILYGTPFDSTTPGFNYTPSPARPNPSPSPAMRRRPSLSPSKRSSISLSLAGRSASEGLPFSPTSPVFGVKQELDVE